MNFLDAITLLQNTYKQRKNSDYYYEDYEQKLKDLKHLFYEKLSQQEIVDEHVFDKIVRIGYGNVLLSFLTPTDAAKLSLVDRQCSLAVYWQKSNDNLRCSSCNANYLDKNYKTRSCLIGHSIEMFHQCPNCPAIDYYDCYDWCSGCYSEKIKKY
jgi:hypothetical protein